MHKLFLASALSVYKIVEKITIRIIVSLMSAHRKKVINILYITSLMSVKILIPRFKVFYCQSNVKSVFFPMFMSGCCQCTVIPLIRTDSCPSTTSCTDSLMSETGNRLKLSVSVLQDSFFPYQCETPLISVHCQTTFFGVS